MLKFYNLPTYSDQMNRIKVVLKEQGRTQTWLALRLHISQIMMALYAGNKAQLKLATLFEISKILGISPKELINDSQPNK